jgi:hypothetical protein
MRYETLNQRAVFTSERLVIEKLEGQACCRAPRNSSAGRQMSTPGSALHRAHFGGS